MRRGRKHTRWGHYISTNLQTTIQGGVQGLHRADTKGIIANRVATEEAVLRIIENLKKRKVVQDLETEFNIKYGTIIGRIMMRGTATNPVKSIETIKNRALEMKVGMIHIADIAMKTRK